MGESWRRVDGVPCGGRAGQIDGDGEILVAARTDPGWVPLYPSASGLLIERGSLLSHSAIMAREHGLPAIVNIPNLIAQVEDGMTVEMDATAGTVRIIDDETASS